jgi:3-deoxy-D-manno-octulosonic-acid transferase
MSRLLYNILLHTVAAPALAVYYLPQIVFEKKYRRSLSSKFGYMPNDFSPEKLPRPRLWFHAVSVGEVVALSPLLQNIKRLYPHASIFVSTGTETGQDKARSMIPEADAFLYLPLDFPLFINPVVQRVSPDLFVLMETELWPNLIHSLKKHGSLIALVNGRISDRSFPRYRKLRRFLSSTLKSVDLFLMSSQIDASRIAEMGAPADRVRVTGNTKFDACLRVAVPGTAERLREMLQLNENETVWVAGSTHPGEHDIILNAYKELSAKFPELVLIIVPRHVEKSGSIVNAVENLGLAPPFLRSSADQGERRDGRKIIIVDKTGELFQIFSFATVVFMGGSLVPKGGQNILEPASWGKIVLFGPSMEDFRDARNVLVNAGAGVEIKDVKGLVSRIEQILSDPKWAEERGRKGQEEILKHAGSAAKNAEILTGCLVERFSTSVIGG